MLFSSLWNFYHWLGRYWVSRAFSTTFSATRVYSWFSRLLAKFGSKVAFQWLGVRKDGPDYGRTGCWSADFGKWDHRKLRQPFRLLSHLANFDSGYEATWIENQRKDPDTPVTVAETINIFSYYKIYEILIVSKNGKQIWKAQKLLILIMLKICI